MADIRAAPLQETLLSLPILGAEVERRVLDDLPADLLARIREATRVAWLPMIEVNGPVLRAIRAHAGDEGVRDVARAAALRSATTRFFGPIDEPLIRMSGLEAGALLRVPPTAYRAAFRGMGELALHSTAPRCVRFALRRLPAGLDREPFLLVVAGAIESAIALARETGRAEVLPGGRDADTDAFLEARWPVDRAATARPFGAAPPAAARPR